MTSNRFHLAMLGLTTMLAAAANANVVFPSPGSAKLSAWYLTHDDGWMMNDWLMASYWDSWDAQWYDCWSTYDVTRVGSGDPWTSDFNYRSISATGSAWKTGGSPPPVVARVDLDVNFTLDTVGAFSISAGGNGFVTIDGWLTVTNGQSLDGFLAAGQHHMVAQATSEGGTFAFTIPSPGPLSLALLGGGLLCSRRRRAAH